MRTPQSGQPGQEALARQGREAEGRFAEALAETNTKPHSMYNLNSAVNRNSGAVTFAQAAPPER